MAVVDFGFRTYIRPFDPQSDPDEDGVGDACDTCPGDVDGDLDGVCDASDLCPNTIPGATVDATGCPPRIPGDFDRDGDVDGDDVAAFEACASGPAIPLAAGCEGKDFDNDSDSDQSDFSVVQLCYSGQNSPGDPNCAH